MRSFAAIVRAESLKGLLAAVPLAFLLPYLAEFLGAFSDRPWYSGSLLLIGLGTVASMAIPILRDRRLVLGGGFLGFFVTYCALFSIAAETDLLSAKRRALTGFEQELPRNFLSLNGFGDWHYYFAKKPSAEGLVTILLPEMPAPEGARNMFAALIRQAVEREAKAIVFDYYLESESRRDQFLCDHIDDAKAKQIPVVFGYRHVERDGVLQRLPLPQSLQACLGPENLGSLAGYLEFDGRVRMVPAYFRNDKDLPSLSLRAASALAAGPGNLRTSSLIQFIEPVNEHEAIRDRPNESELENFRDRVVFVGSQRSGDIWDTPFGELAGARIHMYAAACLATGGCIKRPAPRWTFPAIYLMCFLLTLVQTRGGGWRGLGLTATALSIIVISTAAFAMWQASLWIDISYPLLALWVLAALLSAGAIAQTGRVEQEVRLSAAGTKSFDIFLSHNGSDKQLVRDLAEVLGTRGLAVWLDERELTPGRPWQEALEEIITTVKAVAVLVGKDGLGPWEKVEMRMSLDQAVERNLPIIPVLLEGAPTRPELPLSLRRFTWVDMRSGFTNKSLDKLEWGITGTKPRPTATR